MSQEISSGTASLEIPAFGNTPAIKLDMSKTRYAEGRIIEAKTVNPSTYSELEYTYNEAYRELVKNQASVGFHLTEADKALETAKSAFLIDEYPKIMENKPKSQDSADMRKAYLMRDKDYVKALDRVNMLKAYDAFVSGRIKVFEKTCAYMKKRMDLLIRSGLSGTDMYITHGKK